MHTVSTHTHTQIYLIKGKVPSSFYAKALPIFMSKKVEMKMSQAVSVLSPDVTDPVFFKLNLVCGESHLSPKRENLMLISMLILFTSVIKYIVVNQVK